MTKSAFSYVALFLILACISSWPEQLSAQAPSNAPKEDTGSVASRLQVSVPLVLEDVVVLDRSGQPVHGLSASDFAVTEDGKAVVLRNFEENTAPSAPAAAIKPLHLGPNTFTNFPRVPPGTPLNILLLDALNTPIENQTQVRQQMLDFIKDLPPNTRIAVFGLASRLYLLQGFTSDPAVLRAAIEQKHAASISSLLDNPASIGGTSLSDMMSGDVLPGSQLASIQQFEAELQTENDRLRMIYTLEAMNQLARYLAALPGRKNLVWFSGSFPLNVLPDEDLPNPFIAVDDFRDDVRQTAQLFAQSRVAVYPVDARGMLTNRALSVTKPTPMSRGKGANSSTIAAATVAANHKFFTQTTAEYATMDLIAKETGGEAFYISGELKQAVEKALNHGGNFYTLSFTPKNQNWDGSYRRISIRVDRPGLRLYFRPGYFADNPEATPSAGQKVLPTDPMHMAMLRGAPDATQVLFDVGLIPAEKQSDQLSAGARPDARLMKPPYMRYTVRMLVDIKTIQMLVDPRQGAYHGGAGLAVAVYSSDGAPVNSAVRQVSIDVPPDQYADALEQGVGAHLDIDVPLKGEYFLRIGVEDLTDHRVGSLEVPVSALQSLKQLQAAAAATATPAPAK